MLRDSFLAWQELPPLGCDNLMAEIQIRPEEWSGFKRKRKKIDICFKSRHYDKSAWEHSQPKSWLITAEQTVNSSITRKRTGRSSKGKEGGENFFKRVCDCRVWPVEKPCPGLQNALLYKGSLRVGLLLDFHGALKADDLWPISCVGVFLS